MITARNGVTPERLRAAIEGSGCTLSEARRIVSYSLRVPEDSSLSGIRQVRRAVREAALQAAPVRRLRVLERRASRLDPFVKYAFETHDGLVVEAVRIPLERAGRFSVCLSSQVGCAMGCTFCATARMPVRRDLDVWEIVDQVSHVAEDLPPGGHVHGAVFMGMGEPMLNLDAVIEAAAVISHPAAHAVGAAVRAGASATTRIRLTSTVASTASESASRARSRRPAASRTDTRAPILASVAAAAWSRRSRCSGRGGCEEIGDCRARTAPFARVFAPRDDLRK